ncbi:hypothetical protein [Rubinisphaera margarita]|uniref:hypothetical protein n=1 Tax=Rubinisphaera margarita TaxID=2909586 RepID=UPI001EE8AD58|nr:hypothetical protein [Rubinisphaera margarita]MCG6155759.1 hypothetical protein [Rubinisphaera margarita]
MKWQSATLLGEAAGSVTQFLLTTARESSVGDQFAAGILSDDIGVTLLSLLPIPIVIGAVAAVHYAFPEEDSELSGGLWSESYKEG